MELAQARLPRIDQLRVFLCDDVDGYRHFLRSALSTEVGISVVGEATDARTCLTRIAKTRPDVVLLDISMPTAEGEYGDGLWAIPRIRAMLPDCAIVVLSALSSEVIGPRATSAGASHYLEKGVPIAHVAEAIREAALG